MKLVNLKNILFGTFCATATSILSTNAFAGVPCNITCPTGYQKVQTATSCYCDKLSTPDNSTVTLQQYNDTAVVTINGVAHDWNNTVPTTLSTGTNEPGDNNSTDCAVKQVGEDYVRCCKDEGTVETCETKGYQSGTYCGSGKTAKSYAITLNGQSKTCYKCEISVAGGGNGGGCSNTCYSSCSANGGSVYYTQNDWHNSGGQQIYANGCNTGDGHCFCVKGATSGGATGLVVAPGGTGGGVGGGSSGPIQFQGDAIR